MMTKEISQSLYTDASYLTGTLEEELGRIQRLQYECLNEDTLYYNIGAFSAMNKSERVQSLLEIQQRLRILHESSAFIEEAVVYIPELGRKISSASGVDAMGSADSALLERQQKAKQLLPFYDGGRMYLGASYPYNVVSEEAEQLFTLVIRLSGEEIGKKLNFLGEYPDSGVKLTDCGGQYELHVGKEIQFEEAGEDGGWQPGTVTVSDPTDGQKYTMYKMHSEFLDMDLFAYISDETVYKELYIYRNLFWVCLAAMMAVMAAWLYSIQVVINSPIKTLVRAAEQMEQGDLSARIEEKREDEFGYVYVAFNRMAESLQNQMEINYKQKLLTQKAELKHLQAQINPHFLYNSFFTLYRMAKDEDCESMVEFSSYLSEYYRYITKSAQSDTELKAETEHARRYGQIQAMRFKRRLKVEFEPLPEAYEKMKVPRLILHPLLENAFEHGLNNVEQGGLVHIWYEERGKKRYIHVEDNGAGMTEPELETLQKSLRQTGDTIEDGLCNINRRLKIKFGEDFGIEIESAAGGGTRCSLVLPAGDGEEGEEHVSGFGGG